MLATRPSSALKRSCWTLLLGLMLAIRLSIPAGFMPAWDKGRPAIVVCDEANSAVSRHADSPIHKGKHGSATDKQPCPYAMAAGMAIDHPPVIAGELAELATSAPPAQSQLVTIGRGLAAPPPPSTGPPLA